MSSPASERDMRGQRRHRQAAYESARTVCDVARRKMHKHLRIASEHKKLMLQHEIQRETLRREEADVSTKLANLSELAYVAARALYQESFDDMMRHKRMFVKAEDEMNTHKRLLPQFAKFDARMRMREKYFTEKATGRDKHGRLPEPDAIQWLNSSRAFP
jgi:hypothetical protein